MENSNVFLSIDKDKTSSLYISFADCLPDQNSGAGNSNKISWTIDLVAVQGTRIILQK